MCGRESIGKFEKALTEAMAIASKMNIPPLKGCTLLLLSVGVEMKEHHFGQQQANFSATKKSHNDALTAAWLLAYMAKSACEHAQFAYFDSQTIETCMDDKETDLLAK